MIFDTDQSFQYVLKTSLIDRDDHYGITAVFQQLD